VRLNKYISETGVCSRREADKWIEAGRVTLNGQPASLGTQVADGDEVRVDGDAIGIKKKQVYIALNKPVGIICTTEAHIEDNIIDHVGYPERIFPVGRLDRDSEGLILLTNNGDIVNEILRSENNHEKEYLVTVDRPITDLSLRMLADGVKIMGELTKPSKVARLNAQSFRIILTQGLNRHYEYLLGKFAARPVASSDSSRGCGLDGLGAGS
jgi:23S rRNA pseudouridine2604 synthase